MKPAFCGKVAIACIALALAATAAARADIVIEDGYLDYIQINSNGAQIDIGMQGGGVNGNPNQHTITIDCSNPGTPCTFGGIGGVVRGTFFVTGVPQVGGQPPNLDALFDASNQLIQVTDYPTNQGVFNVSAPVGPAGTVNPYANPSRNFPPATGGSAAIWTPGMDNDPDPSIYSGQVLYDFFVSVDGFTDYDPRLLIGNQYVITALVGDATQGAVTFGTGIPTAPFSPGLGIFESKTDLFNGSIAIQGANPISSATLLASVAI
ncbi:MAG TPA: hypothetical protein VGM03_10060, partial [Phycisphaerae bacterium]